MQVVKKDDPGEECNEDGAHTPSNQLGEEGGMLAPARINLNLRARYARITSHSFWGLGEKKSTHKSSRIRFLHLLDCLV